MIAWNAVNSEIQRQQELAEALIRFRGVVLDEVAGDKHAVRAPVGGIVVVEDLLERLCSDSATQFASQVGKQVRVSQV